MVALNFSNSSESTKNDDVSINTDTQNVNNEINHNKTFVFILAREGNKKCVLKFQPNAIIARNVADFHSFSSTFFSLFSHRNHRFCVVTFLTLS